MKKFLFFLILFIFLVGCSGKQLCESPFIEKNGDCCLDMNEDGICDTEEKTEEVKQEITGEVVAEPEPVQKEEIIEQPEIVFEPIEEEIETEEEEIIIDTKERTAVSEFVDMFNDVDGYKFLHKYDQYFIKDHKAKIRLSDPLKLRSLQIDGKHHPIFYVDTIYLNRNDKTAKGYCEGINDQFFKQCSSMEIRDIPINLYYGDHDIEFPEDWLLKYESKEPVLVEKAKYYVLGMHTTRLTFEEDETTVRMYLDLKTGLPIRIEFQKFESDEVVVIDYPDLHTGNIIDGDVIHRSLSEIPPEEAFKSTR